jgi:IclR family transcriptional regulator, blcABC operon repressor
LPRKLSSALNDVQRAEHKDDRVTELLAPSRDETEGDTLAPPLVPAVVRALALLEHVAQARHPVSASGLAAGLGLPRSSVHGLCNTLLHHGYLRRHGESGGFSIGPGVMGLAEAFIAGTSVAHEFSAMWDAESHSADESVILSVLNETDAVYVAVRNSPRPLGLAFNVGVRLPAWLSGSGKAMLAWQPDATLQRLFPPGPLSTLTGRGPSDTRVLFDELAAIRRRGYSIDDEGVRAGVLSFGAPVFDAGAAVVAGVAMCINKSTLDAAALESHRSALLDTARRLTRRIGGKTPRDYPQP